jgi:nucleotide-binding universal stress UspA family protein
VESDTHGRGPRCSPTCTGDSMRDVIAYPGWHVSASAFARDLAAHLQLRSVDLPWLGPTVDAALAVAPVGLRSSRAATTPVVVLTRRAATATPQHAASVVCGVQDDDDAACVAIAGALAEGLGLPLILVHVVTSVAIPPLAFGAQSETIAPIAGRTGADPAAGPETLDRVARAAGLRRLDTGGFRLVRGTPGPTLAATVRREQASLVVVSRSKRGRLQQALLGSVAGYLLRRCERPVVVCPRDPAAAMRVRAALSPLPDPRARRG